MSEARLGRRQFSIFTVAGVLVFAVVHSMAWYFVTAQIEAALPGFVLEAGQLGWRLEGPAPVRSGWPWTPSVSLVNVVATRSVGSNVLRWTADRVDLSVGFLDLGTLWITPTGNQAFESSSGLSVRLRAGHMQLRVPLSTPTRTTLDVRDLAMTSPGAGVEVRLVQAEIAPLAASLAIDGATIRPSLPAPFDGPSVASIRFTANVPLGAAPAAWRSAGGQVEVPEFTVRWGPLMVTGNGSGGLDDQLQPEGRATVRIKGGLELLDALTRAGAVAPAPASAARAVLGLLTLAAPGRPVSLPVTLINRTLGIAQFPLLRLPLVEWDAP